MGNRGGKAKIFLEYGFVIVKKICLVNISLHNFAPVLLIGYLSRKAEGNGPLKPWQPCGNSHSVEGANSITCMCVIR
jgi:hypothetical protein